MLQSKTIATLFIAVVSFFAVSWFSKPSLEDQVQAMCEKQAFRYIFVKDMYDRELKVCTEVTIERIKKEQQK